MILGLGLDVVEIRRVARLLEGPAGTAERFVARCFTADERAYCEGHQDRAVRYAARFAAKEAALKALGAPAGATWRDLEVGRDPAGRPTLAFAGAVAAAAGRMGVARVHLSLTHDGGVAAATVVVEGP